MMETAEIEIRRSFDAPEINRILNDPGVFPSITVPGLEAFDVSEQVENPNNYFLCVKGGCVIFTPDFPGSGLYEVHTNFLPGHRGLHALKTALATYRWMFTRTDCMMLQTRVPAFNKAAERFCKLVGASLWFERKAVWPTESGPVDMKFFVLSYMDWSKKHSKPLIESGRLFHERLLSECERLGSPKQGHLDEDCHDLHVGACAEMIYGRQPEKAVILYNRWARLAGYGEIALLRRDPVALDIGDAVLVVQDQTFKVVKCRQPH